MSVVRSQTVDDVELARRATAGNGEAFGQLFQRWFDRAFDVAWHVVRNRDTAAEVTQDAFTVAWQQIATLRQPESFGGWLLRITRNRALNRLSREQRSRPLGDEEVLVVLDGEQRSSSDPAAVVPAQERDDLVWAASAALGADDASLLSLHLRHGLDAGELASELGVAPNAAHQRLFRLRKRLGDAIGAWTLWQRGSPGCAQLQALLGTSGAVSFDRASASTISTHARSCDDCQSRRDLTLSPEALFAATPLVLAGPVLKTKAAAALAGAGVPVSRGSPGSGPGDPSDPGGGSRLGPRLMAVGLAAVAVVAAVVLMSRRGDDSDAAAPPVGSDEADDGREASDGSKTAGPSTTPGTSPMATATTDPPLVDPGTSPSTAPPSGPDPTTTTTSTTSTTTPPPPAPVIGGFRATPVAGSCSGSRIRMAFSWESTDATSALLGPSGGIAEPVAPDGTATKCALHGSSWTLQVTGPGGSKTAKATVP
jgi:RNA polymerase sigma factor (sigma-70 family)